MPLTVFSKTVHMALTENKLDVTDKLRMLRESASFFYGICPYQSQLNIRTCRGHFVTNTPDATNREYWVKCDFSYIIVFTLYFNRYLLKNIFRRDFESYIEIQIPYKQLVAIASPSIPNSEPSKIVIHSM